MKFLHVFIYVSLTLGLAVPSALAAPPKPETFPKDAQRQVVGIWKLNDSGCTRAIEQIASRFFMVARCPRSAERDGSIGIPLTRVSENSYENPSGLIYEIDEEGYLLIRDGGGVFERSLPQRSL
jgi:hypothetical protein